MPTEVREIHLDDPTESLKITFRGVTIDWNGQNHLLVRTGNGVKLSAQADGPINVRGHNITAHTPQGTINLTTPKQDKSLEEQGLIPFCIQSVSRRPRRAARNVVNYLSTARPMGNELTQRMRIDITKNSAMRYSGFDQEQDIL